MRPGVEGDERRDRHAGPNVAESGIAGVQRQAELEPSGWLDQKTFEVLRSVQVPAGLPHAGELAIDGPAVQLLKEAYDAYERARRRAGGRPGDGDGGRPALGGERT